MDKVLSDIGNLSSGTMATLTGERRYEDIERIQTAWFLWASLKIAGGHTFETWSDAWEEFKAELTARNLTWEALKSTGVVCQV